MFHLLERLKYFENTDFYVVETRTARSFCPVASSVRNDRIGDGVVNVRQHAATVLHVGQMR